MYNIVIRAICIVCYKIMYQYLIIHCIIAIFIYEAFRANSINDFSSLFLIGFIIFQMQGFKHFWIFSDFFSTTVNYLGIFKITNRSAFFNILKSPLFKNDHFRPDPKVQPIFLIFMLRI